VKAPRRRGAAPSVDVRQRAVLPVPVAAAEDPVLGAGVGVRTLLEPPGTTTGTHQHSGRGRGGARGHGGMREGIGHFYYLVSNSKRNPLPTLSPSVEDSPLKNIPLTIQAGDRSWKHGARTRPRTRGEAKDSDLGPAAGLLLIKAAAQHTSRGRGRGRGRGDLAARIFKADAT